MNVSSYSDVMNIINLSDEELVRYLQNVGLLKRSLRCKKRNCRAKCVVVVKRGICSLNTAFYCKKCKIHLSVLKGTFFSQMRVTVRDVLMVMWCWACEVRSGCTAMLANTNKKKIIQLYRYFRDILSWKLIANPNLFLLGR